MPFFPFPFLLFHPPSSSPLSCPISSCSCSFAGASSADRFNTSDGGVLLDLFLPILSTFPPSVSPSLRVSVFLSLCVSLCLSMSLYVSLCLRKRLCVCVFRTRPMTSFTANSNCDPSRDVEFVCTHLVTYLGFTLSLNFYHLFGWR